MSTELQVRAALRELPSVDEVLRSAVVEDISHGVPRWAVVAAVRDAIEEARVAIRTGDVAAQPKLDEVALRASVARRLEHSLRRVINATGVVLHTNLGRAPLAARALTQMLSVANGYCNLEYDLDGRQRGSRHDHVSKLLAELCVAEAACVTNNNAAAVLLVLAALAAGREVIVSRGELVEIGGSFRIPDVMRAGGALLREVGTTNKTHGSDYRAAISDATAMLLKVHRSNFAVVGFVSDVSLAELAVLGREHKLPVVVDLGSGSLADLREWGLPGEPTVPEVMRAGADLVTFSGDKLLGGPQAGMIVGRATLVERVSRHPLMRAVRPDKLTLAALEGTLTLYRDGRLGDVPVLQMLGSTSDTLRRRARQLVQQLRKHAARMRPTVVEVKSQVGGGALPLAEPMSYAVALSPTHMGVLELEAKLRFWDPPVIARIEADRVMLDVRCLSAGDLKLITKALAMV